MRAPGERDQGYSLLRCRDIELAFGGPNTAGSHLPYGPGGWFALQTTPFLETKFGVVGLWLLMIAVAMVAFMLATEMAFYPALVAFGALTIATSAPRRRA